MNNNIIYGNQELNKFLSLFSKNTININVTLSLLEMGAISNKYAIILYLLYYLCERDNFKVMPFWKSCNTIGEFFNIPSNTVKTILKRLIKNGFIHSCNERHLTSKYKKLGSKEECPICNPKQEIIENTQPIQQIQQIQPFNTNMDEDMSYENVKENEKVKERKEEVKEQIVARFGQMQAGEKTKLGDNYYKIDHLKDKIENVSENDFKILVEKIIPKNIWLKGEYTLTVKDVQNIHSSLMAKFGINYETVEEDELYLEFILKKCNKLLPKLKELPSIFTIIKKNISNKEYVRFTDLFPENFLIKTEKKTNV